MQQAYLAVVLVLFDSFLCPRLVISAASGIIHHAGAMQKRAPVNFAGSRHDAQFTQEAHDFEGLKKQAMQAAKAKNTRRKSSRSAQPHIAWLLESEDLHISSVC